MVGIGFGSEAHDGVEELVNDTRHDKQEAIIAENGSKELKPILATNEVTNVNMSR